VESWGRVVDKVMSKIRGRFVDKMAMGAKLRKNGAQDDHGWKLREK